MYGRRSRQTHLHRLESNGVVDSTGKNRVFILVFPPGSKLCNLMFYNFASREEFNAVFFNQKQEQIMMLSEVKQNELLYVDLDVSGVVMIQVTNKHVNQMVLFYKK